MKIMQAAYLASATLALSVAATSVANAASEGGEREAISKVMAAYNEALNASSTAAVMPLYADDGVFMPPFSPAAVGTAQVRQAYDEVFKSITLNVKFNIAEIVLMAPNWAFVRTNSSGKTTVHTTGEVSAEGNQELFVFKKQKSGRWKIERYSFSSTQAK